MCGQIDQVGKAGFTRTESDGAAHVDALCGNPQGVAAGGDVDAAGSAQRGGSHTVLQGDLPEAVAGGGVFNGQQPGGSKTI